MVTFKDERDPLTIEEVDPENMELHFPGVRWLSLEIEITNAPLTRMLTKRLPWLETMERLATFETEPAGSRRPPHQRPVTFLISQGDFFGAGWHRTRHLK
jgi:hypothetical protein